VSGGLAVAAEVLAAGAQARAGKKCAPIDFYKGSITRESRRRLGKQKDEARDKFACLFNAAYSRTTRYRARSANFSSWECRRRETAMPCSFSLRHGHANMLWWATWAYTKNVVGNSGRK